MALEIAKDRRAVYRTVPEPDDALEVELKTPTGKPVRGEVADVSSIGAGVLFNREVAPALAMGESATLLFTSPILAKPIEVRAELVARTELETSRRYAFRFVQELLLGDPRLHRIFNRRGASRASPRGDEFIEVRLRVLGPDHSQALLVARCRDISATGIGLETDIGTDKALKAIELVEVSFDLPGSNATQTLLARIADRRLTEGAVLYGLRFDTEKSQDFSGQQDDIIAYVMRRQREEDAQLRIGARSQGSSAYHSRQIRHWLIESFAYPRWVAAARIDPQSCPHGGCFDDSDPRCRHCSKEIECRWLNTPSGSADASGLCADELIDALDIAVGFVGHHDAHHDRQVCDCQTCSWLRDTRHLLKRYRKQSAKMV